MIVPTTIISGHPPHCGEIQPACVKHGGPYPHPPPLVPPSSAIYTDVIKNRLGFLGVICVISKDILNTN